MLHVSLLNAEKQLKSWALQYFNRLSEQLTRFFLTRWTCPCTQQGSALHTLERSPRPAQSSLDSTALELKRARSGTGSTWTPYTPAGCTQAYRDFSELTAGFASPRRRGFFFGILSQSRVYVRLACNAGFRFLDSRNAARICDNINSFICSGSQIISLTTRIA